MGVQRDNSADCIRASICGSIAAARRPMAPKTGLILWASTAMGDDAQLALTHKLSRQPAI